MDASVLLVIVFQLCLVSKIANSSCQVPLLSVKTPDTPDYYWRDYAGIIPKDAVQGGTDKAGYPTYIGKAYIKDIGLLPAMIYTGCKSVSSTAGAKELKTEENVEILCSSNQFKLEWKQTKHDETHLLTNCKLVVGGSEIGHNLNIGRALHDGQTVVGKVFSYPLGNSGLWIPYQGVPIRLTSYEVLTYNCEEKSTCLDVRNAE